MQPREWQVYSLQSELEVREGKQFQQLFNLLNLVYLLPDDSVAATTLTQLKCLFTWFHLFSEPALQARNSSQFGDCFDSLDAIAT